MLSCNKYCIVRLLSLLVLFTAPMAAVQAQIAVVSVKVLSEKGNYEWEGVVDSITACNPEFQKLAARLNQHTTKTLATNAQTAHKDNKSTVKDALSKLEQARQMGLISEEEYQKMKAETTKADELVAQQASGSGNANPAALKEQIRQYCVGKRFYRHVCDEVRGVRRVDVGSHINSGVDMPRYRGFINNLGQIMVAPDRYTDFNLGISIGGMSFNTEDKAIAHIRSMDGRPSSACMIDNRGRVLLSGDYLWLSFFMDCHLLKAGNPQRKYGIIDYDGNVLEPFVHNDPNAEGMYQAKNRIMKEKGWTPIRLF